MENYKIFNEWREKVFEEGLKTVERNFPSRSLFRGFLSELMEVKFYATEFPKLSEDEKLIQSEKLREELADALNYIGFLVARYKNPLDHTNDSGKINLKLAIFLLLTDFYHMNTQIPQISLSEEDTKNYELFINVVSEFIRKRIENPYEIFEQIDKKLIKESVKIENFMRKYDERELAHYTTKENPYSEVVNSLHNIFTSLIACSLLYENWINIKDVFETGIRKIEIRSKEYESGKRKLQ